MLYLSFVSMKEFNSHNKLFFIYRVSLKNQGKCSEYFGSGNLYALPENVPDRTDEGDFKKKKSDFSFWSTFGCFSSFWLIASTKTCHLHEEGTHAMPG